MLLLRSRILTILIMALIHPLLRSHPSLRDDQSFRLPGMGPTLHRRIPIQEQEKDRPKRSSRRCSRHTVIRVHPINPRSHIEFLPPQSTAAQQTPLHSFRPSPRGIPPHLLRSRPRKTASRSSSNRDRHPSRNPSKHPFFRHRRPISGKRTGSMIQNRPGNRGIISSSRCSNPGPPSISSS